MRIFVFIVLFLFLVFAGNTIFAGISVSTGAIEVVASKEEEIMNCFQVTNPGSSIAKVNIEIINFSDKDTSPSEWISIEPIEFELKAGETKDVISRIKPPMGAKGELRARIYISGKDLGGDINSIGVRFNMPVYVAIQNTIKLGVQIEEINVKYNSENKEIEGEVLLNNASNVHIRPEIKLMVKDLKDSFMGNIVVPFGQPAQKEESRMFIFKKNISLNPGMYKLAVYVDYGAFYGLKEFVAEKEINFEIK